MNDLAKVPVTDELRSVIRSELQPELDEIASGEMRDKVVEAWAVAIANSSFGRIADMRSSGRWNTERLVRGSQAHHVRGVAAIALKIVEVLKDQFPEFSIDRDVLVAGALVHDVGKAFEFDPVKRRERAAAPGKLAWPSVRHPPYGLHICLTVDLPLEVAAIAGGHSNEGEFVERSTECTIVMYADLAYWRPLRKIGLMVDDFDPDNP
jgi:hypothetical protein